jgi:hypothetical protein
MNAPGVLAAAWDPTLEPFAAELTEAAYPIALRHGAHQHWLALQLDLWHALATTVQKWSRQVPGPECHLADREDFLAELTDAAYHTILCFGVRGSFLDVELSLHQKLRSVLVSNECASQRYWAATSDIA